MIICSSVCVCVIACALHSFLDSFPFLLLGNKSDLGVKVTKSEVHQWLQQRGYKNMVYLETSAMNDVNIEESFDQVAKLCLSHPSNQSLYVYIHIRFSVILHPCTLAKY